MRRPWIVVTLAAALAASLSARQSPTLAPAEADPYLWLEDVTGEKALEWVKARNAETMKELAERPGFAELRADLLAILDSKERIPYVDKRGPYYYNFWRDAANPKGLWRRTTFEEYRKPEPKWDVIIDVDALAKQENESWVWRGAQLVKPAYRRALVALSRGGADATVVREFDMERRTFVEDGFQLPEAKSRFSWIDEDHIYVATDFGPGSLTSSGYPRIVKLWKRGTPLAEAKTIFEGQPTDVSVMAVFDDTRGFERHFVLRSIAFYRSQQFLRRPDGTLVRIEVPEDAIVDVQFEWMTIELRTPWTVGGRTYPAGALLAARFDDFLRGRRDLTVLFEPTPTTSLAGYTWTRHHLVLNVLDDVKNRLFVLTPGPGEWKREPFQGAPPFATASVSAVDAEESDEYFLNVSGYLTPTTLLHGRIGEQPVKLKQLPAFFDASGLEVSQHFATSKDGTRVPYFQVSPKGMPLDGARPTLLYGYGGFEIALTPSYNASVGRGWLSRGGVYVVANIRGGGEYGPRWHQAALKQNRLRAYEDFAAVAEDLIRRKVTSPRHLGIMGGSNGGLLVGNMLTLYPHLFGAVVCQVPLLDMRRYSKLLAGASWMAEYGDPDKPEEWAFIRAFSPYHNVRADVKYPPVLFTTSTRDDRVHPGHARKMMAKMREMGHDVRYYENIEGGHAGAADNRQLAHMQALAYTFLWAKLGPAAPASTAPPTKGAAAAGARR
ncbi:MAG TPA: prolyl oligopeptidase family serine peptidase [Vicinamibacterales bacterium]|nr:prolyl oligopeptidase family serine peptidase [Vicinamibacterales bacterium]